MMFIADNLLMIDFVKDSDTFHAVLCRAFLDEYLKAEAYAPSGIKYKLHVCIAEEEKADKGSQTPKKGKFKAVLDFICGGWLEGIISLYSNLADRGASWTWSEYDCLLSDPTPYRPEELSEKIIELISENFEAYSEMADLPEDWQSEIKELKDFKSLILFLHQYDLLSYGVGGNVETESKVRDIFDRWLAKGE